MDELEAFHWDLTKLQPTLNIPSRLPLTLLEAGLNETWQQRIQRMLRPLRQTTTACSMCSLGQKRCYEHQTEFDPHVFSNMNPSKWMIIGQNPGYNESIQSTPFIGETGQYFNQQLERNGIQRNYFYITNAVKCHTLENKKPTYQEMQACNPILQMEINLLKPILIITLGVTALEALCPDQPLTPNLGKIIYYSQNKIPIIPLYHPSPRNMNEKFEKDLQNICQIILIKSGKNK